MSRRGDHNGRCELIGRGSGTGVCVCVCVCVICSEASSKKRRGGLEDGFGGLDGRLPLGPRPCVKLNVLSRSGRQE